MTLKAFEKFLKLRRESRGGREKPYKPLMLLTVIDLIEKADCSPRAILWNGNIETRFKQLFEIVKHPDDACNFQDPFPRLHTDGIWKAIDNSTGHHYTDKLNKTLYGQVAAIPEPDVLELFLNHKMRTEIKSLLISRYFPKFADQLNYKPCDYSTLPDVLEQSSELNTELFVAETETQYEVKQMRKASFRNEITELYDYQCAACGMRIKIPKSPTQEITFVDAAHLIPFSESQNDHPTNGISLCKNHHWAMDQKLIAPTPDKIWKVSDRVDPRHSEAAKTLYHLNHHDILLPQDPTYHPAEESLEWRAQQLLA